MDAFRYFLYMSDPVKRNLSSTVISCKPVLCVGWKTGLCQSLLWLKWFLSSAIRFRVLLSKVSRLVCMNLKKGVNITTQGKSMVFITRYFKVMNSLPVAIVSLYTRLLLLCFDTSFRFVYQYHGGLVFLFCFCRIKAKKQTDLIMFYPSGNKAFFFFFLVFGQPWKTGGRLSVFLHRSLCQEAPGGWSLTVFSSQRPFQGTEGCSCAGSVLHACLDWECFWSSWRSSYWFVREICATEHEVRIWVGSGARCILQSGLGPGLTADTAVSSSFVTGQDYTTTE